MSRTARVNGVFYKPCEKCGTQIPHKFSHRHIVRFCSRVCKGDAMRKHPKNTPRHCTVCGKLFTPSRKRGAAMYCSKSCIWKATKGPEFNAKIARATVVERAARQRGTGTRGYVKLNGRHEHRVVMEQIVGRPLRFEDVVHHKDENKHNNSPDNLLLTTRPTHMQLHGMGIPGVTPKGEPWKYRRKKL